MGLGQFGQFAATRHNVFQYLVVVQIHDLFGTKEPFWDFSHGLLSLGMESRVFILSLEKRLGWLFCGRSHERGTPLLPYAMLFDIAGKMRKLHRPNLGGFL